MNSSPSEDILANNIDKTTNKIDKENKPFRLGQLLKEEPKEVILYY